VVGGLGNAVLQVGLAFERALARSFNYFLYTLAKGVISLAVSIALVVFLRRGAAGLLLGAALPPLAIGVVIYARLFSRCGIAFSRPIFKSVFEFGGPLVPMNLAMWVLASLDIYLLRRFAATAEALSEVGLYQYAHEICLLLVLPITALNLAWPQFIFSNYASPQGRNLFARVQGYFAFFLIEGAFLLSMFPRQVVGLVGSAQYLGSADVIPLLAGSLVFYGFSIVFASGLYLSGKTRSLAVVVALCAALNVLLNVLLIPRMGKQGSALAALATNLLMMAAVLVTAQRAYRIPYRLGRTVLGILAAAATVAGFGLAARGNPGLGGWLPRLLASCGLSLALFGIVGMKPGDFRSAARTLLPFIRPSAG
jgi:O-antigen/teichoic acid export membrane protein